MRLGERLKFYRKKAGFTLEDLEKQSKVAASSISEYEHSKVIPRRESLEKIAKALGVEIQALIPTTEEALEKDNTKKECQNLNFVSRDITHSSVDIPVYKTIPEGNPEDVRNGLIGYIKMPMEIAASVDYALKNDKIIIIEVGIVSKSIIFVKKQDCAGAGDIVIVKIGDENKLARYEKAMLGDWIESTLTGNRRTDGYKILGVVKYVLNILKNY
jgi:transcriptional regulator with XRE-family HTH domain